MYAEIKNFNVQELVLAGDQGTCGGVNMADQATRQVLDKVNGRVPVITLWDVIHNVPYMEEMRALGLKSLDNLIPEGQKSPDLITNMRKFLPLNSVVLLPAHGSYPKLYEVIEEKGCLPIDLTCQLVSMVQRAAERAVEQGFHPVYGGVENHPETNSVVRRLPEGYFTLIDMRKASKLEPGDREKYLEGLGIPEDQDIVLINQTTLSPGDITETTDWLRNRFPRMVPPRKVLNFICYAMEHRWNSVAEMTESGMIDLLLVVGSAHSHNSQELKGKGDNDRLPSYSVDKPEEIQVAWFKPQITRVGLTSGASVFRNVLDPVRNWFFQNNPHIREIQLVGQEDKKIFTLPKEQIDKIGEFLSSK